MFRWICSALAGAALIAGAGAAQAKEQIVHAAAPAWVKPSTLEVGPASQDAGMSRYVLLETQVNYTAQGDEHYIDRAVQVLNRQGLESVGAIARSWDPLTEDLIIHRVEIIRDGEVIDALAQGDPFVALRQEANLSRAVLDGRLTASKQLEDLRVGDIVRFASTVISHDAMLRGHADFTIGVPGGLPIDRMRQRHIWPKAKPVQWKTTPGYSRATETKTDTGSELVIDARDVEAPVAPDGSPDRFKTIGLLMISDFRSWREVSALFAADYEKASTLKPNSPLHAEVGKIRQAHPRQIDQASAALSLVEERVRYLALSMGQGGYNPAGADQT